MNPIYELKELRQYWIENFKTLNKYEKAILSKKIILKRDEADEVYKCKIG